MATSLPPMSVLAVGEGAPSYLGTIDATTTSKTNSQATTAFNASGDALKHKVLLVQVSAAALIHPVASATATVTTNRTGNHGVSLAAGERVTLYMGESSYLAAITASGTSNVDVWELK